MNIRIVTLDDASSIQKIYAYYVGNTDVSFEYDIPSVQEMQKRIEETLKTSPFLVAEKNGRVVGYAYASQLRSRIAYQYSYELSVYIDKDYHRQGIARMLYIRLLEILKLMNVKTIYACISYPNLKSETFHQTFGFKKVGHFYNCGYKFDKWIDVIYMQKTIGDYQKSDKIQHFCDISSRVIGEILY